MPKLVDLGDIQAPPPSTGLLTKVGRVMDAPRSTLWGGEDGWSVLRKLGIYDRPGLDPVDVLAFGLEVVGDPLTYLGVGGLSKAGKLASQAAKGAATARALRGLGAGGQKALGSHFDTLLKAADDAAGKGGSLAPSLAEQAATGQRGLINLHVPFTTHNTPLIKGGDKLWNLIEKTGGKIKDSPLGQGVLERFHTPHWYKSATTGKWARKGLDHQAADFVSGAVRRGVTARGEDLAKSMSKLLPEGAEHEDFIRYIETGEGDQALFGKAAEQLKGGFDELLELEQDLGTKALDANVDYYARVATPEMKKWFRDNRVKSGASGRYARFPHAIGRNNKGTFDEKVAALAGKTGVDKPFETDPALVTEARFGRAGSALGELENTRLKLANITDPDGVNAITMARRLGVVEDLSMAEVKALAGVKINPDHANELFQIKQKAYNPDEAGLFKRLWDKVSNIYRFGAISIYPAYYVRNAYSNTFMNWVAGVGGVDDMAEATRQMRSKGHMFTEARMVGAVGRGFSKQTTKELGRVPKVMEGVKSATNKAAEIMEDTFRLAHYIGKRRQGLDPMASADSVRRYLFNYDELTPFEQKYMKGTFLFYTWTRNVLPFLARETIENTGRIGIMSRFATQPSLPRDEVPHYLQETPAIPFGNDQEGKPQYLTGFGMPLEEVGSFDTSSAGPGVVNKLGRLFEKTALKTVPQIKAPLELLAGKDFFTNKELEQADKAGPLSHKLVGGEEYQTESGNTRYRGNPTALWALRNVPFSRLLNVADKMADDRKGGLERVAPFLSGLRTQSFDPEIELTRSDIKALSDELSRHMAAGKVGRYSGFFPVGEGLDDAEIRALLEQLRERKQFLREKYRGQ